MVSRVKVGVPTTPGALNTLLEAYTPRTGRPGNASPLAPLRPEAVDTRILLSLAGLTRILVMERPLKTSVKPSGLGETVGVWKGPFSTGLTEFAPVIM